MRFILDIQQLFFFCCRAVRQVPADQPKAQECDFSHVSWAEL